jgi:hypothetical protein
MRGKPRRAWLKGIKAWRLRTKESPCMYENEYINTTGRWVGVRATSTTTCTRTPG